jgi:hypothetical protein
LAVTSKGKIETSNPLPFFQGIVFTPFPDKGRFQNIINAPLCVVDFMHPLNYAFSNEMFPRRLLQILSTESASVSLTKKQSAICTF